MDKQYKDNIVINIRHCKCPNCGHHHARLYENGDIECGKCAVTKNELELLNKQPK